MQHNMFSDIVKMAERASSRANEITAKTLTSQFRTHLITYGISPEEAKKCSITHNPETDEFVPNLSPAVLEHTLGNADTAPSGVVSKFFAKTNITKEHSKAIMDASRDEGLL